MLAGTIMAVLSPEGWLDPEAHDSDLRGSRGVAAAGVLLIFMGVANFRNTVRKSCICKCACFTDGHGVLAPCSIYRPCSMHGLGAARLGAASNTPRHLPITVAAVKVGWACSSECGMYSNAF